MPKCNLLHLFVLFSNKTRLIHAASRKRAIYVGSILYLYSQNMKSQHHVHPSFAAHHQGGDGMFRGVTGLFARTALLVPALGVPYNVLWIY